MEVLDIAGSFLCDLKLSGTSTQLSDSSQWSHGQHIYDLEYVGSFSFILKMKIQNVSVLFKNV